MRFIASGIFFYYYNEVRATMKKFLRNYKNPASDKINHKLINREYDGSIVEYIIGCCKSLEVLDCIKFTGYQYITDESKIDTSEYISKKARGKNKNKKITRYMYLEDSRYAELRVKFHLSCNGEEEDIVKKILVPVPNSNNYYTIKGNKYFLMYQIVDNSTYTTKKSLTLKSMMPVQLQVDNVTLKDVDGNPFKIPTYSIRIFSKQMNIMLFYLAHKGFNNTLRYLSLDHIVNILDVGDKRDSDHFYFPVGKKLVMAVNKVFFGKYQYVRSMVAMLLDIMPKKISEDDIMSKAYWATAIGILMTNNKNNQYDKGVNTLTFFDRMLDDTTRKILKLHPIHTQDIYSLLRWMLQHFDQLVKKDSMSLDNRRLRCNEYIAALLTTSFSDRLNRALSMGKKVTMDKVKDIFKFHGDILISQLHKSDLLRFDDAVNDLDFFGKLKVTFKGPNSLGGTNENNISAKYRGIDPSYIGRIDLNYCGTSDPGTSALITPQCETHGLYFNDEHEPEDFKYKIDKDIYNSIITQAYDIVIGPKYDDMNDYFDYQASIESSHKGISDSVMDCNIHLIEVAPLPTLEDEDDYDDMSEVQFM